MKYIVLSPWNEKYISNNMFYDLVGIKSVSIMYLDKSNTTIKPKLLRKVYNYIFDKRWLPKKNKIRFLINRIVKESNSETFVLMTNEMLCHLNIFHLQQLRNNNIKLVLLLIDPLSAEYITASTAKEMLSKFKFDIVFTFDIEDALKYKYDYCNTLYSKIVESHSAKTEYDICYLGNLKDRLNLLHDFSVRSEKNECNLLMKLSGCENADVSLLPNNSILKKQLSYRDVIDYVIKSNCIFEITQKGQTGVTFRYYEAIVYNKKLLTNNRAIKKMPFYNEKYIMFYDTLDDIDWEWVKKVEDIDYGYKGEFSPIRILEQIEGIYNGK